MPLKQRIATDTLGDAAAPAEAAASVTVHLLKMAVGITDIDHLRERQQARLAIVDGVSVVLGYTRRKPRRAEAVVLDGSIYWIIKGQVQVRQRVLGLVDAVDSDGVPYCQLHLDPTLVPTVGQPRRPMQGWRYLDPADVPADLGAWNAGDDVLPPALSRELRSLGLL